MHQDGHAEMREEKNIRLEMENSQTMEKRSVSEGGDRSMTGEQFLQWEWKLKGLIMSHYITQWNCSHFATVISGHLENIIEAFCKSVMETKRVLYSKIN